MGLFVLDEARRINSIEGIKNKIKRLSRGYSHHPPDEEKYNKVVSGPSKYKTRNKKAKFTPKNKDERHIEKDTINGNTKD